MSGLEKACLHDWRTELLAEVKGEVLEIGAGTGANLAYYPNGNIRLLLSEPDAAMRKQLEKKIALTQRDDICLNSLQAEKLLLEDNRFDYVIASLVCCSVTNIDRSLAEIYRVLKPGGRYLFLEHVAAKTDSKARRLQEWLTPLWRKFAGNCHLNRETEKAMLMAGFELVKIQRDAMPDSVPAIVRSSIHGIAVKPLN
ncbi:MAG: class I SAM-dependent methyltransferase [Pseudomonadota bacterium]|nr:class I SAM-dependent methyltransferase [Pseudomonadota bacterium]